MFSQRGSSSFFQLLAIISLIFQSCSQFTPPMQPNILFIGVDDLRPEINAYGAQHIQSPHLDRLANEGLTFTRAYCNVPVCGASRASLMTGIKPSKNRFVGFNTWAEKDAPEAISLPEHFKNNGYYTISNGKIFHHRKDMLESWSEEPWRPKSDKLSGRGYLTLENKNIIDSINDARAWPYEWADVPDEAYNDGIIAQKSIEDLKRLAEMDQPFFLAVGFMKPHLPFNAPKKYWDLYPKETIDLPDNYFIPENSPESAIHNFGELRNYFGVPKLGPISDDMAKTLIRGYYACVSYTDAQIGKLLNALDELDLRNNTVVILWGDHGWQLGEHTLWCKHSNFDVAMRVPMIISVPGYKGGLVTDALVEYIDIFPSLSELAGLDQPEQLHGRSFIPLLNNPNQIFKDVIYSRYIYGESIKTDQYLYTEWYNNNGALYGRMLYDHYTDPAENVNISEIPENKTLVDSLSKILHREMEVAIEIGG